MDTLWQDVRYGWRSLKATPVFAVIAVLTLALGIGANTAMFSVLNSVLLRPLPYPESERLVWLTEKSPQFPEMSIAYPNYTDWRARQSVFEHLGVYNWGSYNLTGKGTAIRLSGMRISADALVALKVQPALGRLFDETEDKPAGPPVVLLGHDLWKDRFGGDASVLGKAINLDGKPFTVVGVMGKDFAFPSHADIWLPVGPSSAQESWNSRGNHPGLRAVARLKPGVTIERARNEMNLIAEQLEKQYPDTNKDDRVGVEWLLDNYVQNSRAALWTLLGAVGLVLLIACGNVANLLLARAAIRQKEMSVRFALGAGKWRIARQLLTESLILSLAGGVLGLGIAVGGVRLILALDHGTIPRASEVGVDGWVLLFTAVAVVVTGLLFGLAPVWQATRSELTESLKDGSRGATGRRSRLRHGLVVAEAAMALIILAGAGLLLKSFHRLESVNPGFVYENVLTFQLDLPDSKYASPESQLQFTQRVLDRIGELPGVKHVAMTSRIPLGHNDWETSFVIDGLPHPEPGKVPSMAVQVVSPDYFKLMNIPLLRGRAFDQHDDRTHLKGLDMTGYKDGEKWAAGMNAIVIDQDFARKYWGDTDPVGRRIRLDWGDRAPVLTVVGVVGRVKLDRLSETGGFVQGYLSALQAPSSSDLAFVMKTIVPPETLTAAVTKTVQAIDPEQPVFDVQTLSEIRSGSIAPQRFNLVLLGTFAAVALLLAAIGLYGVLACSVSQRRREIGVRMALGARKTDVLLLVVGHGMKLAVVGGVVGLIGAAGLSRLLESMLFEVKPLDLETFGLVTLLLIAVALLACWVPARRAAECDPMAALRCE